MSVGHLQEAPASRQFLMHPGTLWFLRLQRLGQEEALSAPSPALTERPQGCAGPGLQAKPFHTEAVGFKGGQGEGVNNPCPFPAGLS